MGKERRALLGREAALRADEEGGRRRACRHDGGGGFATLLVGEEEGAGSVPAGEQVKERRWLGERGKRRSAALLGGLDHVSPEAREVLPGVLGAPGQHGLKPRDSKLGRLLGDEREALGPDGGRAEPEVGHRLAGADHGAHLDGHLAAGDGGDAGGPFPRLVIEQAQLGTGIEAEHGEQLVGLRRGKREAQALGEPGRDEEARDLAHGEAPSSAPGEAARAGGMALTLAVTGGTGFVGGHVLAAAAGRGHAVRALTRRPQPPRQGVDWVRGDLADMAALGRLVEGADAVIHVAGVVNARDAAGFAAGNVAGTAAMRMAAGRRPFVHVSSLAARAPRLSAYGASKLAAEHVARGCAGRVAMVRPPAVYGPGDTEMLALFRAARLGLVPVPRGAVAAMIFAPDLAAALVALAEDLAGAGRAAGGCFEIDDGTGGYPQTALVEAIGRALGRRARAIEVPGAALWLGAALDTARARMTGALPKLSFDRARYLAHPDWRADSAPLRALGLWRPTHGLAEGLAKTVSWYRMEGWL